MDRNIWPRSEMRWVPRTKPQDPHRRRWRLGDRGALRRQALRRRHSSMAAHLHRRAFLPSPLPRALARLPHLLRWVRLQCPLFPTPSARCPHRHRHPLLHLHLPLHLRRKCLLAQLASSIRPRCDESPSPRTPCSSPLLPPFPPTTNTFLDLRQDQEPPRRPSLSRPRPRPPLPRLPTNINASSPRLLPGFTDPASCTNTRQWCRRRRLLPPRLLRAQARARAPSPSRRPRRQLRPRRQPQPLRCRRPRAAHRRAWSRRRRCRRSTARWELLLRRPWRMQRRRRPRPAACLRRPCARRAPPPV